MNQYKDYLFILNPSERVKENIKLYKEGVGGFIGNYPGITSTAHLSLWHQQKCKPYIIDAFISAVQKKVSNIPATRILIDGFNYFTHGKATRTIYASVKPTYLTDNWFATVRQSLNLSTTGFMPHITVAKAIPVNQFNILWPQFSTASLQSSFVPQSITILERTAASSKWNKYHELYFKDVNTYQA